jgi:hypothetical protein
MLHHFHPDEFVNGDRNWLRDCSPSLLVRLDVLRNMWGKPIRKSGVNGVCFDKNRKKWIAQIEFDGKHISLGRFSDFFSAVCARKSAEQAYCFHVNHGLAA